MATKKKKTTKKMPDYDIKGTAKIITIAPTKDEVIKDWQRANRNTKYSLVMKPATFSKFRLTKKTPKLR